MSKEKRAVALRRSGATISSIAEQLKLRQRDVEKIIKANFIDFDAVVAPPLNWRAKP